MGIMSPNAQDVHGIVHEVIIDETPYEYGLTSCRRDFVWKGSTPDASSHWYNTFIAVRTHEPNTCMHCLVAPPWCDMPPVVRHPK